MRCYPQTGFPLARAQNEVFNLEGHPDLNLYLIYIMHEPYVKTKKIGGGDPVFDFGHLLVPSPALAQHGGNKKLSNISKNADVKHGNKMSRAVFSA